MRGILLMRARRLWLIETVATTRCALLPNLSTN
jgi:hypothetical protein